MMDFSRLEFRKADSARAACLAKTLYVQSSSLKSIEGLALKGADCAFSVGAIELAKVVAHFFGDQDLALIEQNIILPSRTSAGVGARKDVRRVPRADFLPGLSALVPAIVFEQGLS